MIGRHTLGMGAVALLGLGVMVPMVRAQESATPVVPAAQAPARAPHTDAILGKTFAVHLTRVTLRDALAVVSKAAEVHLVYSDNHVPLDKVVSLAAEKITLRDALSVLLEDTGLSAVVGPNGAVWLQPTTAGVRVEHVLEQQRGTATISGSVRDSVTGASIPQVTVRVDGTTLETKSGGDGTYKITGVAAGEYRVTVRRVGYIAKTRTITLTDGQSATLNFGLNPPATTLDEVVTTAVGAQRRYEVGNVIATINVDSLAPTAPVTNVTDVLTGRVPGLEVEENNGLVGSGEAIRIRGISSVLLSSDPILIVDGIRQDATPGGTVNPLLGAVGSPSRINDIDFSQIATIDVLKGPAAAAEYGTDAANGVIIITTKRGTSGKPQWNVSAEQDASNIPTGFPELYYGWGHTTTGASTALIGVNGSCTVDAPGYFGETTDKEGLTSGGCMLDSVTHFNPLNHAATTEFGTGPSEKYDVFVSGGSDAFRYGIGGGLSNAIGPVHLPSVFAADALALGFPATAMNPNSENQRSIRANTDIYLGSTFDLALNASYISTYQESPQNGGSSGASGGLLGSEYTGFLPAIDDSADYYGYCPGGSETFSYFACGSATPLATLGQISSQQTDGLTGGLTARWQPRPWFTSHGTLGLEHESQDEQGVELPQAAIFAGQGVDQGQYGFTEGTTDYYTGEIGAAVTAALTHRMRSITSAALQMRDERDASLTGEASNLTAFNLTLNGATNPYVAQTGDRNSTLGGFVEEELNLIDRLFVTASYRLDAGSGFGRSYNLQPYRHASVSWLTLQNEATTVRLRGAIGEAGVQPPNSSSLQVDQLETVWLNATPTTASKVNSLGNPVLQPERSVEYEGGTDITLFRNRASLSITGYSRTRLDALANNDLGWDLDGAATSGGSVEENLGTIRETGVELEMNLTPIQQRNLTWTVHVSGSIQHNQLVSVNAGFNYLEGFGAGDFVGYPLDANIASYIVRYQDVNHDGILEANEVSVSACDSALGCNLLYNEAKYEGTSQPTQNATLQTYIGIFRGALTISGSFDYAGGFRVFNDMELEQAQTGQLESENIPGSAPLWGQAVDEGALLPSCLCGGATNSFQNGSYLSFRELSVTYTLPRHWTAAMRVHNLSVTGAVRNLALWTAYDGDPEVSVIQQANGGIAIDSRISGFASVPLTREWFIRLNLGF